MKRNRFFQSLLAGFCALLMLFVSVACQPATETPDNSEEIDESSFYEDGSEESSFVVEDGSKKPASSSAASKNPEKSSKVESSIPESSKTEASSKKPSSGDFVITRDGQSCALIVYSESSDTENYKDIALDLAKHIQKITGVTVKIGKDDVERKDGNYILVGPTKYTSKAGVTQPTGYPGEERVIIKRKDNYLVLIGNDDGAYKGTQFAVNMFLEELGCGWFAPEKTMPLWTVIPSIPNLSVGNLNVNHVPEFETRISGVWFNYKKFSERWYLGGEQRHVGHGLEALVSREQYYSIHPEWFALCDGSRDPYKPQYWQYCYTNHALAVEVGNKIVEYFDANPSASSYSIGANDAWNHGWCECTNCSALGSDTDEILYFANNVAKVVAKKYPNKRLSILSYHSTYKAPVSGIKAHPMIDVMFCRETSMVVPLDADLTIHSGYNWITQVTYTQSWIDNFHEYISKTELKNKSIWIWYCIAADKASWQYVPWVQGNVATRDQAVWKKAGVDFLYYDSGPAGNYRENEASFALRWPLWYVAAKGAWDTTKTGEEILAEACDKLYGPASKEMLAYYIALADSAEMCTSSTAITWVPPEVGLVYTPARIKVIDQAVAAVRAKMSKCDADQKARIENQLGYWQQAKAQA